MPGGAPGLSIDLDYVDVPQLLDFLHQAEKGWYFPTPNYVVNSGTGLHVYYRFPEKISLSKIDPQPCLTSSISPPT